MIFTNMKKTEEEIRKAADDFDRLSFEKSDNQNFWIPKGGAFIEGVKWLQEQDNWIRVDHNVPLCTESGVWDGKRSDFVLAIDKEGTQQVLRCYSGFMDGGFFIEWADKNDYTIENITHWQPLPESPTN